MHQQPGYWNGNKRSAVRKFDLGYSDTDFPVEAGSCDGSHAFGPAGVMADRSVSHDTRARGVS